jgi:hypothetical protein
MRRGPRSAALLACLACLVVASPAAAAIEVTSGTGAPSTAPSSAPVSLEADLGPPNYQTYCESLGSSGNTFTPEPNKQWGCLHADHSVTLLNVQQACEFTYTQRPIIARQLTPGVLYTWQCFLSSGGSGASGGSSSGGASQAQLTALLQRLLVPRGRGAKISALLRSGGYALRFSAPLAGRLSISWYYLPKRAHLPSAKPKPTLVATMAVTFHRAASAKIKVALTAKGRKLLGHPRHIKLTARGAFAPSASAPVVVLRTFTLSR